MNIFTFNLMVLLQRVDDALSSERCKARPDGRLVARLRLRRDVLMSRLRRSLAGPRALGA
ncbi:MULTISPECIES: hypothetical protein [unclassified Sphingobium]|uniref:hypothetical protein n=1 Tax=unclassified Sphingobium TaxID=2611147 RepID=UPI002224CF63|nr:MULTISPECIES: hypothetical protein [unclassified Sphingobium]MCW2381400.1 hypothetical protein [Sphingobium sp. B2D3B]MCW2398493.1 hypothetical protein [Sphingobium sp. B2D3C]